MMPTDEEFFALVKVPFSLGVLFFEFVKDIGKVDFAVTVGTDLPIVAFGVNQNYDGVSMSVGIFVGAM